MEYFSSVTYNLESGWSKRVQYWPYCAFGPNIVLFDKKTRTTFNFRSIKNRSLLIKNKLIIID